MNNEGYQAIWIKTSDNFYLNCIEIFDYLMQ